MQASVSLILWFMCALAAAAASADAPPLLAASGGEHLWIVRPVPASKSHTADLLHHALDSGGPYAAATVPLHVLPEAIAAHGDRVWIVSPPRTLTSGSARDVLSLRIRKRPEFDLYVTEPETRFTVLDSLRGDGELASFAATASGPVALIRYQTEDEQDSAAQVATYRLHEFRSGSWSSVRIPAHVRLGERVILGVDGPFRERINILTADPENPSRSLLQRRDSNGWAAEPQIVEVDAQRVRSLVDVRGRLVASVADTSGQLSFAYVRPGALLPLAQIALDDEAHPWTVAGMNDGIRIISQPEGPGTAVTMSSVHWLSGTTSSAVTLTQPGLPTGRLMHMTIMLTVTVIAVLLVLIVRPGAAVAAPAQKPGQRATNAGTQPIGNAELIELPAGVAVLPPVLRIVALLIDLVPGGILAVLILRSPPSELLRLPILTNSLDQAAAYLFMIGVMFVHVMLSEVIKGTSLGKMLVGGRVLSIAGTSTAVVTPLQAIVRNLLKLLILMIPPLAIFALLSRNLQGFNDILARTIVVTESPAPEEEAPADEE